ncbi:MULTISPECIES: GNAT family N-acetyltransferase [unclassified Streptomyces]|uniref:GNAT family N-acetyltransferase n=1 Tax=unclassified Streptomyces TaxID=2593676 RepID=UPI001BE6F8CC|nr:MULTISPECIES: GNAT family N-acetyltransferase [unclassified Streptomyces]MBT2406384.1 GNAT family N-acetyltransferase [Streptomyces sp. ISL-21]MBT2459242.1 GNAT family N-acetyltransferase [Streptomyces sp. ISL-86]MBT2607520.1 GNAT family N-acetyltransferase [Streptomyces sp. ISL-87]
MTTGSAGALSVTLCRDPRQFATLEEPWNRLVRDCPTATPFQNHAWLHSWWLSYGKDGRLRIVLVRRGDELVGAAALMLVHRPLPLLVPLGGGITDYFDVLVAAEHADQVVPALARGLHRAARGAVVDLREVRPGAAAEAVFEAWPGVRTRLADSTCMELPALPFDELVKRMPASGGQRVRAKLRKTDAAGIEEREVTEQEVPRAVRTLLRLHEKQWRGRGVTPEHLKPRFAEHLTRATRRMVRAGEGRLTEFRLDGKVVAANVTLLSAALSGGYLYGADPDLRARKVDVTTLLLRYEAGRALAEGHPVVSFLRGNEPYKNHWRPDTVVNQRFLLATTALTPLLRLHESQVTGRERAVDVLREALPAARDWRARLNELRVR